MDPLKADRTPTTDVLRQSDQQYQLLFECHPQPMWVFDAETLRFIAVNEAAIQRYGYSREEFFGMTVKEIRPQTEVPRLLHDLSAGHRGLDLAGTWKHQKKDGTIIDVEIVSHELVLGGRTAKLVMANDVTGRVREEAKRMQAEEKLRRSEERYRRFFEEDLAGDALSTPDGRLLACNPSFVRMFGFASVDEALSCNLLSLYPNPEARGGLLDVLRRQGKVENYELELRRRDGKPVHVIANIVGKFGDNGELAEIRTYLFDNTERRQLEEQYRQAQKMEAVGRLTSGIAHDFNNLMTAVLGYSDLALQSLDKNDPLTGDIEEIKKAGERAGALTRQLLAFSRKQLLQPKVIDLNQVVTSMDNMLRHLIGEDIDLVSATSPSLGSVRADVGQIEQVIVNLAVNARDAMPEGGKITIETSNVELDEPYARSHAEVGPGRYVMLAVSDTGHGMDAETRDHIFEPFFTTKQDGKGTGLGLATVFGIVKQSGGSIWVYSEPGRGTTFKIYLPRVDQEAEAIETGQTERSSARGSETVLLVEDDQAIRSLARRVLEKKGYEVLEADNAEKAILVSNQRQQQIDLLLTDVVLTGASGPKLAAQVRSHRPKIKVLYMSGYTDEAIFRHQVLDAGVAFIQKPFTPESLTRKIREVLASS